MALFWGGMVVLSMCVWCGKSSGPVFDSASGLSFVFRGSSQPRARSNNAFNLSCGLRTNLSSISKGLLFSMLAFELLHTSLQNEPNQAGIQTYLQSTSPQSCSHWPRSLHYKTMKWWLTHVTDIGLQTKDFHSRLVVIYVKITFINLADPFIQSDLQLENTSNSP